jgi:hypothetical protein
MLRATVTGIEHDLKLRPAHVVCDVCKDQWQTNHFHKWQQQEAAMKILEALRDEGWIATPDLQVCPRCREKLRV